jgi:hypothetical protein
MNKAKKRMEEALTQRGFRKLEPDLWGFMPNREHIEREVKKIDIILAGGVLAEYVRTGWLIKCRDRSQMANGPDGLRGAMNLLYYGPRGEW